MSVFHNPKLSLESNELEAAELKGEDMPIAELKLQLFESKYSNPFINNDTIVLHRSTVAIYFGLSWVSSF